MENASKALLIAGSVLISVLIVGALVIMFNRLSAIESSREQTKEVTQLSKMNESLEAYNRKLLYGTDIISISNLIADYNSRYGGTINPSKGYREITVDIYIENNVIDTSGNSNLNLLVSYASSNSKLRDYAISKGQSISNIFNFITGGNAQAAENVKSGIELLEKTSEELSKESENGYEYAYLAPKKNEEVNKLVNSTNWATSNAKFNLYKKTLEFLKDFKRKMFTCAQRGTNYSDGTGVIYDNNNGSITEMHFREI